MRKFLNSYYFDMGGQYTQGIRKTIKLSFLFNMQLPVARTHSADYDLEP